MHDTSVVRLATHRKVLLALFFSDCVKLTCLINDSAGVVATNTAAVQLANARDKPW